MKKISIFIFCTLTLLANQLPAQIEVAKLVGKETGDFLPGFGAFLKFNYPISEPADISAEVGLLVFMDKDYPEYAVFLIPVKLGYRHTLNGSGAGMYVQPQVGMNVSGYNTYYDDATGGFAEDKIKGFIWAAGFGYLFNRGQRGVQMDIGLRYESVMFKGGSRSYIGLRLTHNFTLGRRNE